MKKCTGCERYDNEPLGLNKNREPYLSCCPDNNYVEVSPVQWLYEQLKFNDRRMWDRLLQRAKELEKEKTIDSFVFAYLIGENDITIEDATIAAEKHYNEKYNNTERN